jgi:hypothetical protein
MKTLVTFIAGTAATALLGGCLGATPAGASTPPGGWDSAFCRLYMPQRNFDPGKFVPSEDRWEKLANHYWQDRELHRDVYVLAYAIDHHMWNTVRLKQFDAYGDCQGG